MQYRVPQNIDLEDKIVGPFTAKQFIYLMVGFSLAYILVISLGTGIFALFLIVPVVIITIALTFVKVQDRPFEVFLRSIIRYIGRPKRRVWGRIDQPIELVIKKTKKKEFKAVKREKVAKSTLEQLSASLDTKGNQPIIEKKNGR